MPRPTYPSDEARRKTRPHVRVHLTIRHHPRFAHIFRDPELRGVLLGLWVVAREAHAGKTGDQVTLTDGDLVWITGRAQRRHALSTLRALCVLMEYTLRDDGVRVVVEVRNFAKKQGLDSALRGVTPHTPHPSESESEKSKRREEAPESPRSSEETLYASSSRSVVPPACAGSARAAIARERKRQKTPRSPMPADFPDAALRAELAADFADLDLDTAIAEFHAYALREEAEYRGLRGWTQALRGALLRDRGRGMFTRGNGRAQRGRPQEDLPMYREPATPPEGWVPPWKT